MLLRDVNAIAIYIYVLAERHCATPCTRRKARPERKRRKKLNSYTSVCYNNVIFTPKNSAGRFAPVGRRGVPRVIGRSPPSKLARAPGPRSGQPMFAMHCPPPTPYRPAGDLTTGLGPNTAATRSGLDQVTRVRGFSTTQIPYHFARIGTVSKEVRFLFYAESKRIENLNFDKKKSWTL